MKITQGIKMAFNSILSNKLRSFLTMLGIIIGVSAVISLVALGQGSAKQVTEQVQSLGSNLLTVFITGRGTESTVDYDYVMSLQNLEGVKAVSPVVSGNVTAKYSGVSTDVSVEGTNDAYEDVRDFHVQEGRFLLPIDIEYRHQVALLGVTTAQELFGNSSPVGEEIYLNGISFKVVGLLEEKGSTASGSSDEIILIPLSTAERLLRSSGIRNIYIQAESQEQINLAMMQLENELTNKFRGDEDSYRVFNQQDLIESMASVSGTMTMMLTGIAAISLLVGGIGIMNIMLVSVTERTKEIGIRKALGAKKRDILIQFLIESTVVSGMGGLIGICIGIGVALTLSKFMSMDVVLSMGVSLAAFAFSAFVGIFFGIFPANKAASLKPIDALRSE